MPNTRYFSHFVTSRPVEAGGMSFTFERVEPMGGSWLGVLATDEESAANILAAAGFEISQEQYDSLKKKVTEASRPLGSSLSRTPTLPPMPMVAGSASRVVPNGNSGADPIAQSITGDAPATVIPMPGVAELKTTKNRPPPEPLLDNGDERRPRRKAA